MKHLLSYGGDTEDVLLLELAEECERYLALIHELRSLPAGDRRDDAEGDLYGSIAHLSGHGQLLIEHLDILLDETPDEPEEATS